MKVQKFVRKPMFVDAVLVTVSNMAEVAEWCNGRIETVEAKNPNAPKVSFIRVNVIRANNDRQTQAFPGDWVLKSESGCKIYTHLAFIAVFHEVTDRNEKAWAEALS